jgi:pyruvate,water dikinase
VSPAALVDAVDSRRFGGKASGLARALLAGLPVPPGFALSTEDVEAVARRDPSTLALVQSAFAALNGPCAVRSSAVGEDSKDASFAGQHVTVLNVRHPARLVDAVLAVRASAHQDSARDYRRSLGMDDAPLIAVVVQRMVEPDCAGVMFTRHPVSGADERVVEAAWGLGEAVVAGLVIPDNVSMDRAGRVLRHAIGQKDLALRGDPDGGTREERVPSALVEAPCLTEAMLGELAALATGAEAHFGRGLDIEWASAGGTLYLLQCRPITRAS